MARRTHLYNLPVELLTLILDYLSVRDILSLSEDPDFPLGAVRRHHIENVGLGANILHSIARIGWMHIPQIRTFMQILGTWDISLRDLTPLGLAAQNKHYDLCRFFIEAGAQVNPPKGTSPLWAAACNTENDDVISLLVQHGADVCWKGPSLSPVIFVAAEFASVDTVKLLLSSGADVKYISEVHGPILNQIGDPAVARLLIEHGADVNAVDLYSRVSPLILAAAHGLSELVDVFLDAGAKIDYCSNEGESALSRAIFYNHTDIVRKLISAGCEFNESLSEIDPPLLLALEEANEDIVRLLLSEGVDVITPRNDRGENSLCLAARRQSPRLCQQLIAAGAEINAKDNKGRTPLMVAIYAEDEETTKFLLDAGADVSLVEIDGTHPTLVLSAGSETALRDIVEYFTEHGIDWLTECDYFIHEDAENLYSNTSMFKLLLGHGTDISKANYQGIGILHFAAWRNDENLVKLLLEHGADASYKDPGGNTPAAWAALMDNSGIEKLLRKAEADREKA